MGTDEILFYGGLVLTVLFLAAGLICAFCLKLQHVKLQQKLEKEYGEQKKDQ